ncbi:MAG: hypothetical protein LBK94_12305 [Prevotellaceae bacterium]|jgi:hypothetical protein|nr:hypothetical protein [Prevotellaceae bacterium]
MSEILYVCANRNDVLFLLLRSEQVLPALYFYITVNFILIARSKAAKQSILIGTASLAVVLYC